VTGVTFDTYNFVDFSGLNSKSNIKAVVASDEPVFVNISTQKRCSEGSGVARIDSHVVDEHSDVDLAVGSCRINSPTLDSRGTQFFDDTVRESRQI
jgi:hypothetical protein